jgi:polysaccharide transporter, PST family
MKINLKITSAAEKAVFKNFKSLFTLQSVNYLLPLLILPYLIRTLGPERFGLIAFAQALIQYFMILTDYGFNLTATRKISLCADSRKKTCEIFSSVMTVKMLLAGASFLILLVLVNYIPRFRNDAQIYLLSFGAVLGNTLFPVWLFQGKEKMLYITRINVIGGLLYAFGILLCVRNPGHYLRVPILNSLFFLLTGVWGLLVAFRKFDLEFIFQSFGDIQEEVKAGWNVFLSIVSINAYTATRVFAVGLLTNNTLTGFYSLAERIANFIQTFPLDSFSQAAYPRLNKIFLKNKTRAARLMRKAQRIATTGYLITLPLISLNAHHLMRIIAGKDYLEATAVLRVLLLGVLFVGINAFQVQFLLVSGKSDIYSRLHVLAALIGLPLIFLLIRSFSYLGAALSTALIEAGILMATTFIFKRIGRRVR